MLDSQSPPLADKEWLTDEERWSVRSPRDLDARSNPRNGKWPRPRKPPIHSSLRSNREAASPRASIGRRIFRSFARFFIPILIGVGVTLGWQSYGDVARQMIAARAPTLAWLLPVSTTKSPVVAATSPDLTQQLAPLALNLDAMRRGIELLAAKQEQMTQNMAALQAVEEDTRQKMSSMLPSPVFDAASVPQSKPPQPRTRSTAVQSSSTPRPPPPAGPPVLLSH